VGIDALVNRQNVSGGIGAHPECQVVPARFALKRPLRLFNQ
jgi:hypothetical protein